MSNSHYQYILEHCDLHARIVLAQSIPAYREYDYEADQAILLLPPTDDMGFEKVERCGCGTRLTFDSLKRRCEKCGHNGCADCFAVIVEDKVIDRCPKCTQAAGGTVFHPLTGNAPAALSEIEREEMEFNQL